MAKKNISSQEDILEVAKILLLEEDITKFSMRKIAQKADIAVGTLYNYFDNKEEILLALAAEFWKEQMQQFPMAMSKGQSFEEEMRILYHLLKTAFVDFQEKWIVLLRSLHLHHELESEYHSRLEQVIKMRLDVYFVKKWKFISKEEFSKLIFQNMLIALESSDDYGVALQKMIEIIIMSEEGEK